MALLPKALQTDLKGLGQKIRGDDLCLTKHEADLGSSDLELSFLLQHRPAR